MSRNAALLWLVTALTLNYISRAESFEELSARATAAREANHLPAALKLYRAALELDAKWQEGWWYLGTIAYDTNDYTECRDALKRLLDLKPDAGPALGILGLCEFETGEFAASLSHIQHSLATAPPGEAEMENVLRYHEAILLVREEDYDEALQKYVWFVRGTKPSNTLLTALGLAALRTPLLPNEIPSGQQDLYMTAGSAAFSQMSGDRAAALRAIQVLLERYPAAHHVHYLYACWLLATDPSQGIKQFLRELEITPNSGGTLAMLAWALLNQREAARALPYAEKAVHAAPIHPLARYVLGRSLVESGDVEPGIRELEQAAREAPDNLETHLALAAAYPKARRYEDARRERQRSLDLTRGGNPGERP